MTRIEHLMVCLMEECAEVSQRASKALRFGRHEVQPGQDQTNVERLVGELNDLLAVLGMLRQESIDFQTNFEDPVRIIEKIEKVERFLEYSRKCGTLQD
jgi:NTP pyrophosphatase (non-canonical NTP hydrolase)